MSGFRPRRLLLCLVAISALLGAFGLRTGSAGPAFNAAQAGLEAPSPMLPVTDKQDRQASAYIWSATRIESSIRLRGAVPTGEDRRTVLGMVKAHFPDLDVEDKLKIVAGASAPGSMARRGELRPEAAFASETRLGAAAGRNAQA